MALGIKRNGPEHFLLNRKTTVSGNNFLVTPAGMLSACNRMAIGNEIAQLQFIFGYFCATLSRFVFDRQRYAAIRKFTIDSIATCDDCFARLSCRGDCIANKATIDHRGFSSNPSYRCEEVKRFLSRILLCSIDDNKIASLV